MSLDIFCPMILCCHKPKFYIYILKDKSESNTHDKYGALWQQMFLFIRGEILLTMLQSNRASPKFLVEYRSTFVWGKRHLIMLMANISHDKGGELSPVATSSLMVQRFHLKFGTSPRSRLYSISILIWSTF